MALTVVVTTVCIILLGACTSREEIPMTRDSVQPGTEVTFKQIPHKLVGTPIAVGQALPSVTLVDARTMKEVDISQIEGIVLFLSIVPSLDTAVCEEQTHILGEEGDKLPQDVRRIVISRDTPFAQQRFAKEANLEELRYLSDYKAGAFGRASGLLMDGLMLLARSVVLVDQEHVVRYIQVVPEVTTLPDMEKAFEEAVRLARAD
jgi:thiol peroxidase